MSDLIEGTLIKRYKRFLADVELDSGKVITVHCPNTGAMTGCAEPGWRVWLSRSDSKTRKYPHTWELVETGAGMACIHSVRANALVKEAFTSGLIPGFTDYPEIRTEVKYGNGSRADLLLEGDTGKVYVEVKSVTLCSARGQGLFPDAVSDRGRKHLQELRDVLGPGTRAVMFFCALHEGIDHVSAAGEIDPRYRDTLAEVIDAGVEVMAWGASVSPQQMALSRSLTFSVDPQ
ncbi:sugar fermentation stimulation protein SfsA [Halioglobus japonicus]|uniref:Sugar fermentation stimulation protein homolog n=1 Tax=Halioglobus japonicus TaxID=930805 RepID=A0AAP8SN74_9GAMM|nr:DNA/RNA nuclease SfsA [Halioglobus japonicus]AQA17828.1 sugar fermentation stimulation protein SfsA [Halioglobus japonicus]PLW85788.1 DNA/RNA nuclease SfsA [Halioglobus japonicus]GHD17504.1 sugar fermentation stimulation protein [Halioglobus japonicus]